MHLCSKMDFNMKDNMYLKHLSRILRRETKVTIDIRKLISPEHCLKKT